MFLLVLLSFLNTFSLARAENQGLQAANKVVVSSTVEEEVGAESIRKNQPLDSSSPAQDSVLKKTVGDTNGASPMSELPMVALTLVGLICAIFGLAWAARKFTSFNFSKGNEIKIHSTTPVGSRERISLIEVDGQKLLIGITTQQINCLHAFDSKDQGDPVRSEAGEASTESFVTKFHSAIMESQASMKNKSKNIESQQDE